MVSWMYQKKMRIGDTTEQGFNFMEEVKHETNDQIFKRRGSNSGT